MESNYSLKILFDSTTNNIPLKFDLLDQISQDISRSLIFNSKHEYTVRSKVRREVFTSFLDYLINEMPPNIQIHDIDEYILLNQEFQFLKLEQLIESKKEQFKEDLQYFKCIKEQNNSDQTIYEEQIALKLDDYLEKYGGSIMHLPITSLYNIFNHHHRKLDDHNLAYELIKKHYVETNDSNIFSLLPSLDGMKLSKENLNDSISSKSLHFGFIPTIEANFLLNAVKIQEKQEIKINEIEKTINKQQEIHDEFKDQVSLVIEKLTKSVDELNETTKNQKQIIDELKMIIETQSKTIDDLNEAKTEQENEISKLKNSNEIDSIKSEINESKKSLESIHERFKRFFVEQSRTSPGILCRLKEKEKNHFDRLFAASQSSDDIYNVIDPNTKDRFGTTSKGNFFINFELKEPITINGIKIFSSNRSFPKSFDIEVGGKIVKSIKNAGELNGEYNEMTIDFMPKRAKSVKFIQKGPNWDENNDFLEFKRFEILSSEPKYSKGVFATLVSESENCDPHRSDVYITSSCFDFNSFHSLDSSLNISTSNNSNSWFQIELLHGSAIVYGFRLKRASDNKLKDYKIIGTSDITNPVKNWPVLIQINEKSQDEHEQLDIYELDRPSAPVRCIRIIMLGKNWDGTANMKFLHLDFFGFYISN